MNRRGRISEAALALLGAVVAMWPLTSLLEGGSWVWMLVVLCAFVGAVGVGMRMTRASASAILLVQVAALIVVVAVLNVHDHLDSTFFSSIQDLVREANDTVRHSAAPAPVTPGLLMMLELIVPGLAIAVDFLAVTCRQPALAGVPMMVIYMLSTSNTGTALNPIYFIMLAAAWLTMLAHGTGMLVRAWSSVRARALTPTLHEDQLGLGGLASAARLLGIATIVLALVIPVVVPLPDPHYFAKGLGRGGHGGSGVVGFSTTVSLAKDLRSTNGPPVLTFKTSDLAPPPLRVTVGGRYSGGEWSGFPGTEDVVKESDGRRLPRPTGSVKTPGGDTVESMSVSDNTMDPPDVPAPFPVSTANFDGVGWGYSPQTQQVFVTQQTRSYQLSYYVPERTAYQAGPLPHRDQFADQLRVDPASASRVRTLAATLGGTDSLDEAIRIQNYLRSDQFTYSLTLASTRTVNGKKLDPLSNFLVTKKGYCTQFATAMIMLARADGIPARMALGFLPGNASAGGTYTVAQSNAHAWPELYLRGMGWTRFEPTPGARSGAAPAFTDQQANTGGGHVPSAESTAPEPSKAETPQPSPSASHAVAPVASGGHSGPSINFGDVLAFLVVLAIGLLGALVLPLLARRHRESISARYREHRPVEAQWRVLQSRLSDLGVPPPQEEASPRATERHYKSRAALPPDGLSALHSAIQTLEQERYAAPGSAPTTIDSQARVIIAGVRRQQSWLQRLTSVVLPGTGRAAFARGARRVAELPMRLLGRGRRDIGD